MAGRIKRMIDTIVLERSSGNAIVEGTLRVRFIMKGINPDNYTPTSEDDPDIIDKLRNIADDLNIKL